MASGLAPEQRARLLADLATDLTAASTDLARVLDTAVRAASALVGDAAAVLLVGEDGWLRSRAMFHPDPAVAAAFHALGPEEAVRADEGTSALVAATRRPHVINEVDPAMVPRFAEVVRRLRLHAVLSAPMFADDRYLGMISLTRYGDTGPYQNADVELAADIAGRVALAVATAQLVGALHASEQRYREIVETGLEGVWKSDAHAVTTYVNGRTAEILGARVADIVGQPVARWFAEADQAELARRLDNRMGGRSESYEAQLCRTDGTRVWVEINGAPLRDGHDAVVGTLAMVTDISDRVRSRDLQRRLDQLDRLDSLGHLAGGIAHDFNNLLSIVSGLTDLARADTPPGSDQAAILAQISATVARGAALTHQLLTFGRGRAGRDEVLDLGRVVAELAPLLTRTLGEHIQLTVRARAPAAAPCLVRIDRGHLEQIIVNLAANARDAMQDGGRLTIEVDRLDAQQAELDPGVTAALHTLDPAIPAPTLHTGSPAPGKRAGDTRSVAGGSVAGGSAVAVVGSDVVGSRGVGSDVAGSGGVGSTLWSAVGSARVGSEGVGPAARDRAGPDGELSGRFIRLAISDTGTGMDATTLAHAFEPFYTTKPEGQGTGLGLAGAYGIIRAAGGVVLLYSELGTGTTVKIYLPESGMLVPAVGPAAPEAPDPSVTPQARVLVVEDSVELAEVLERLLRRTGYHVIVTHSAEDALATLAANPAVDLVITDVVMPGMTGPELARHLAERYPALPVIFTSGYTAGLLGHRGQLHADAILVEKPFTKAGLNQAIATALGRAGAASHR